MTRVSRPWMICLALVAVVCPPLIAAPKTEEALPPDLDNSISNGLNFLAKHLEPDGSFAGGGPKVAMTGLGLLAFLASGNTPDLGRHGLLVRQTTDFLLMQQAPDGYFGSGERGMYIHAIAALALAEVYGVESNAERRARTRSALDKAVRVILDAQNAPKSNPAFVGGWRYERNSADSDLSLSGWNVLALRAAQDIGIQVPNDASQRAAEFVMHCYNERAKAFAYQPGNEPQAGETGIGLLCLYELAAGDKNAAALQEATRFLESHPIDDNAPFPYYGTYYVTQAAFQRGDETWSKVGRPGLERLIKLQEKDGGWPQSKSAQEPGRIYSTAMAVQSLAVPYRLLPVYQR